MGGVSTWALIGCMFPQSLLRLGPWTPCRQDTFWVESFVGELVSLSLCWGSCWLQEMTISFAVGRGLGNGGISRTGQIPRMEDALRSLWGRLKLKLIAVEIWNLKRSKSLTNGNYGDNSVALTGAKRFNAC